MRSSFLDDLRLGPWSSAETAAAAGHSGRHNTGPHRTGAGRKHPIGLIAWVPDMTTVPFTRLQYPPHEEDPDDEDLEEEDEEVEETEEDEEEEAWRVHRLMPSKRFAVRLTSHPWNPYTGATFRTDALGPRLPASYAPPLVAVRGPLRYRSGLSCIGGDGYANRDNRTASDRQRVWIHPR